MFGLASGLSLLSNVPSKTTGFAAEPVSVIRPTIVAIAMVVNLLICLIWPNLTSALLAGMLYLLALPILFKWVPVGFVLLMPFVIVQVSGLISLILIESGAYMKEVAVRGGPSTASTTYTFYALLFLTTALAVFDHFQKSNAERLIELRVASRHLPSLITIAPFVFGSLAVAYLVMAGIRTGFPLLSGTDRFAFRRLTADVVTINLLTPKILIAAVIAVGAVTAKTKFFRHLHNALFIAYLAVSFLYGDKFFILLGAGAIYFSVFAIVDQQRIVAVVRKAVPFAILTVVSAFAMTFFIYSEHGARSTSETVERLADRIGGQGQLWYLAVRDSSTALNFDNRAVTLNLQNVLATSALNFAFENRLAPYYFSEKYAPRDIHTAGIHNAGTTTPTMVSEAYGLVLFGYVGLIAQTVLLGALVGLIVSYLARCLTGGNTFNVFFPSMLLIGSLYLYNQGTIVSLIGIGTLKVYGAWLALQFVVNFFVHQDRGTRQSVVPSPRHS